MKNLLFSLVLLVCCAHLLQAQVQPPVNCLSYPAYVAPVSGYPTPQCTLLTPLLCSAAAMVHSDSVDFKSGHIYIPVCAEFGINPLADGRMALCFGRNVPFLSTSSFLAAPMGEVLVFELDLAPLNDQLRIWTYKNGTKTTLATMPAISGLLNLVNGYARKFEVSFNSGDPNLLVDPNRCRLKFSIDGVEKFSQICDVVNTLWGGRSKVKFWISSIAGSLPINTQCATMFATTCLTEFPLLKQADPNLALTSDSEWDVKIAPNPVRDGSFNLIAPESGTYRIVNVVGAEVAAGEFGMGTTRISTQGLSQGVYWGEFRRGTSVAHERLLIE